MNVREIPAGPAWGPLRWAPPVAAHRQGTLRARDGHIGEATFLSEGNLAAGRNELIVIHTSRRAAAIGESQQRRGRIRSQRPRHHRGMRGPAVAPPGTGEHTLGHARNDNMGELQPLGSMDGHEHDGISRGGFITPGGLVEALCLAQPGEE